jgi:hypothetical protein
LKIHLVLSAASTDQLLASAGIARGIGLRQIPLRQRVVHRDAGEAVALETLVGLAERARDVGRGHRDAQDLLLRVGAGEGQREHGEDEQAAQRAGVLVVTGHRSSGQWVEWMQH